MSCQKVKCERLIYVQMSMDAEVHLNIVRILNESQEVDILDVLKASL